MRWLLLLLPLLVQCQSVSSVDTVKLNEIQVLGSHNSYKRTIDPALLEVLRQSNPDVAVTLDYAHPGLTEQLDLGLRKLELDVFYDPDGGRYASPFGLQAADPTSPWNDEIMKRPGYKVFHVQDIDFRSHCALFRQCLAEIGRWSDEHPGHLPLIITINAKDDVIDNPGFVKPLPFDRQAWADLDREIKEALGNKLYTPDDQRGAYSTLRRAVLAGWPEVNALRGKVMFVLDDSRQKIQDYVAEHPSLTGRVMFVNAPEDSAEAAFRIVNDPKGKFTYIQDLVRQGFMVRTRADADTLEARRGDESRLAAALDSGAQIISTDYYVEDPRFGTGYRVQLPDGGIARCNPVLVSHPCRIEEPDR